MMYFGEWIEMMVEMYCCTGKCSKYIGTLFTNSKTHKDLLEWFCPKCIEEVSE
tara:strand:+ start:430 stop:588 length:159 start_codon:yes stop_codon:yes gene_type:complete